MIDTNFLRNVKGFFGFSDPPVTIPGFSDPRITIHVLYGAEYSSGLFFRLFGFWFNALIPCIPFSRPSTSSGQAPQEKGTMTFILQILRISPFSSLNNQIISNFPSPGTRERGAELCEAG